MKLIQVSVSAVAIGRTIFLSIVGLDEAGKAWSKVIAADADSDHRVETAWGPLGSPE